MFDDLESEITETARVETLDEVQQFADTLALIERELIDQSQRFTDTRERVAAIFGDDSAEMRLMDQLDETAIQIAYKLMGRHVDHGRQADAFS